MTKRSRKSLLVGKLLRKTRQMHKISLMNDPQFQPIQIVKTIIGVQPVVEKRYLVSRSPTFTIFPEAPGWYFVIVRTEAPGTSSVKPLP